MESTDTSTPAPWAANFRKIFADLEALKRQQDNLVLDLNRVKSKVQDWIITE